MSTTSEAGGEGSEDAECVSLLSQLDDIASAVQTFIQGDYDAVAQLYPGITTHLGLLRDQGIHVRFDDIGSDAAFEMQGSGEMVFSMEVARGFAGLVSTTATVPDEDKAGLFRQLITLFVLHEARHLSQGFGAVEDVRELAEIGQSDLIGLYDFIADIDACKAYAAYNCSISGQTDEEAFADHFVAALALNVSYCIRAFDFPYDKPHKVGRAMGLILMHARSLVIEAIRQDGVVLHNIRPITDGIFVRPDKAYSTASIQWTEGTCSLLTVEKKPADDWLREMASAIDSSDIDRAIDIAEEYILGTDEFWG